MELKEKLSHGNPPIDTYIVNMPNRTDRRLHCVSEFGRRKEFSAHFITPFKDNLGKMSLYRTFRAIVNHERLKGSAWFLFCEDDHIFTEYYSEDFLRSAIAEADRLGADVLLGGIASVSRPKIVSPHLARVGFFNSTQFTVVFNRFYNAIVSTDMREDMHGMDWFMSYLTDKIYVTVPFVSRQAYFAYSDCCQCNNEDPARVQRLFGDVEKRLMKLRRFSAAASSPFDE